MVYWAWRWGSARSAVISWGWAVSGLCGRRSCAGRACRVGGGGRRGWSWVTHGNLWRADLKNFPDSPAVDSSRSKQLFDDNLHPRKVYGYDRSSVLYSIAHKLLFLLFREIIVLRYCTPKEILTVSPSIAKDKPTYLCCHTRVFQVDIPNIAAIQQEELGGKSTACHAPLVVWQNPATTSNCAS